MKVNSNMARADANRAENKKKELSEKLRQAYLEKQVLINEKNKLTAQLSASEEMVKAEHVKFVDMQTQYISLQKVLMEEKEEASKVKITVERRNRKIQELLKKEDKDSHESNKRVVKNEKEDVPGYARGLGSGVMNYYTPRVNQ